MYKNFFAPNCHFNLKNNIFDFFVLNFDYFKPTNEICLIDLLINSYFKKEAAVKKSKSKTSSNSDNFHSSFCNFYEVNLKYHDLNISQSLYFKINKKSIFFFTPM